MLKSALRLTACLAAFVSFAVDDSHADSAAAITQFDITWTFDKPYEHGTFANGDYWVVGPVKIVDIRNSRTTPGYSTAVNGRTMNGSMINPSDALYGSRQGFDSHANNAQETYDPQLNVGLDVYSGSGKSLTVPVNSSLVTSISLPDPGLWPQLQTAAVLTILPAAPPPGSFRPSLSGSDKVGSPGTELEFAL